MKTSPLVTIGITAYNCQDTLHRAVQSAFNQTWRPLEIVIVDDASTDQTSEVIRGIQARWPEVRCLRNDSNQGVAGARNRLIEAAKGEFLAFFDDDDLSASNRIEAQLNRILQIEQKYSSTTMVLCHTAQKKFFSSDQWVYSPTIGMGENIPNSRQILEKILLGITDRKIYGHCPTASQMARIWVYRLLGGFDEGFRRSEDTDLNVRLALQGGLLVGVAEALVDQFMSVGTDKSMETDQHYYLMLLEKHKAILDEYGKNCYEFCCDWARSRYLVMQKNYPAAALQFGRLLIRHPIRLSRRILEAAESLSLNRRYSQFHTNKVNS